MLEMRSSSASISSRSSRPSMSRTSSSGSGEHLTIAKIAPTMLKTTGTSASPHQPVMVYQPPPDYLSPPLMAGHPGHPPPAFDFPSPIQQRSRWHGDDEDEYGSVGFDYFGGPDLSGGDFGTSEQTVPAHVGTSYGRTPTVGQPPAQAKWRQAPSPNLQLPEQTPSSTSSSSSTSIGNVTSPQPRGILKVHKPGPTPTEPSSPPPSYFNYNPSPATGIGGMRGQQAYEYPANAAAVPVPPPVSIVTAETRGRSASRDRGGSSKFDRSTSRGTSSSSATSISPGTSRSPIEAPSRRMQSGQTPIGKVEQASSPRDGSEPTEVDGDCIPERSTTPTPHSSPQVSRRSQCFWRVRSEMPLTDSSFRSLFGPSKIPRPLHSHTHPPSAPMRATMTSPDPSHLPSSPRRPSPARAPNPPRPRCSPRRNPPFHNLIPRAKTSIEMTKVKAGKAANPETGRASWAVPRTLRVRRRIC